MTYSFHILFNYMSEQAVYPWDFSQVKVPSWIPHRWVISLWKQSMTQLIRSINNVCHEEFENRIVHRMERTRWTYITTSWELLMIIHGVYGHDTCAFTHDPLNIYNSSANQSSNFHALALSEIDHDDFNRSTRNVFYGK